MCGCRLQERKTMSDLDIEIQLLLKQGQVEVDSQEFVVSFSDAVLVPRKIIEDLNKHIKVLYHNVNMPFTCIYIVRVCRTLVTPNLLAWVSARISREE